MTDGTDPGAGSGFPDPTAPSWASSEPTQPIPGTEPPVTPPSPYAVPPTSPPGTSDPWAGPPATAQPPYPPYGYLPPADPAAGYPRPGTSYPPPPYGQVAYGEPAYARPGHGHPGYGYPPYGGAPQSNSGALVLTIVAAVATAMCCLLFTPSLVLGIVALTKQSTDPAASARLTRYGWIAGGITLALGILAVVLFFTLGAFSSIGGSSTYEFDGT